MALERASAELLASIGRRRRLIVALPGSEELRMLDHFGAEASVNSAADETRNTSIIVRAEPSKAALLEEFLHGTQAQLGLLDRLTVPELEAHVKDFMIRHQRLLGLGDEDVDMIEKLRDRGL